MTRVFTHRLVEGRHPPLSIRGQFALVYLSYRLPNGSCFAGFAAGAGVCGFSSFTPTGPRVSFGITTVCSLIRMAYDIKDYQVASRRVNR